MHGGGGVHGVGACMAGACVEGGHAWQGGMCGGGHAWQGACVVGGVYGKGEHACHTCPPTLQDTVGQCAGRMHPTGMHSCVTRMFSVLCETVKEC